MRIAENICESCRTNLSIAPETGDEDMRLYQLCEACRNRLLHYALRPLEFFNLATIHGHQYYLNDDLYDSETGEAIQPWMEVEAPENFPFPELQAIRTDVERVVDFACVQYITSDEVVGILQKFAPAAVLDYLTYKVDYNRAVAHKAYEIAAKVLGLFAEDWIRVQWSQRPENVLLDFAPALAACLPFEEGFPLVTEKLSWVSENAFAENSSALLFFQSPKTLDWMEENKKRMENVVSIWGVLAAASGFDWQRSKKWLDLGRPLSLIALDALIYCTTTGERHHQPFWFQQHPPVLSYTPTPEEAASILNAYLLKDAVPRTKNAVRCILHKLSSD